MRSARSNTTTSWPARVSCWAAASPAGPEPIDGDPLARAAPIGTCGVDPALVPRPVDDLDLDLLDRHRVGVDAEHARRLARRRAQPAGELGEVVRGVQAVDGVAPVVAVDEVVPVRDQVAERAAVVAERDAAVHAAPGLGLQLPRSGSPRTPPSSRAGAPAPAGASASPASHLRNPVVSPIDAALRLHRRPMHVVCAQPWAAPDAARRLVEALRLGLAASPSSTRL